jgi:hypothetical protein
MDSVNYRNYAAGQNCRYMGGEVKVSPARLTVPHDDHWFVALDLGGAAGTIKSSIAIVPPS